MANIKLARKKTVATSTADVARVVAALAAASKDVKRIAAANNMPFIVGNKKSWTVAK